MEGKTQIHAWEITDEQIKNFIHELINQNRNKILDSLVNPDFKDFMVDENWYLDAMSVYVKFELGLYKNGELWDSIEFDTIYNKLYVKYAIMGIISGKWTINDIKCELLPGYVNRSRIAIKCETPKNDIFIIYIHFKDDEEMTMNEFLKYTLKSMELITKMFMRMIEKTNQ